MTNRPLKLQAMMRIWLTQHFANPNNLVHRGLKDRVWRDDDTTGIQIFPISDWQPRLTEKRPALILKRQELKFVRYGIDNRFLGGGVGQVGRSIYMASLQGSHTVFCIAGEGGEAEQLAAEVAQELMRFAPLVRELLNFLRVELVGIGELAKLEEASENFIVPVSIAYAFMDQWELTSLDTPRLASIQAVINNQI